MTGDQVTRLQVRCIRSVVSVLIYKKVLYTCIDWPFLLEMHSSICMSVRLLHVMMSNERYEKTHALYSQHEIPQC